MHMTVVSACYSIPHHEYGDLAKFCCAIYTRCYVIDRYPGEKGRPRAQNGGVNRIWRKVDYTSKAFQKLIGLHSKRFRVSLELKELVEDLTGFDDCVICHWLPQFFSPSF